MITKGKTQPQLADRISLTQPDNLTWGGVFWLWADGAYALWLLRISQVADRIRWAARNEAFRALMRLAARSGEPLDDPRIATARLLAEDAHRLMLEAQAEKADKAAGCAQS